MSKSDCGSPATILFRSTKNRHLINKINEVVVMIGTLVENQGIEEAVQTLKKNKNNTTVPQSS